MNIPSVNDWEFYFETAYTTTKKVVLSGKPNFELRKQLNTAIKSKRFYESLYSQLTALISHFPDAENMSKFYQELLEASMSIDLYKKNLGTINWARSMIKKLYFSFKKKEIPLGVFFGRAKDVMKTISKNIEFLKKARQIFLKFPSVKSLPTALLAGFPNVGKTSILSELTDSKPEINSYPFTTKSINIGLMKMNSQKMQIVDTPGMLERPADKMNEIEKKAIIALKHLADVVLFVFDSSNSSGFSIEEQERLFEGIKKLFKGKKIITVLNKCELDSSKKANYYVSCKTKEGIEKLKKAIYSELIEKNK